MWKAALETMHEEARQKGFPSIAHRQEGSPMWVGFVLSTEAVSGLLAGTISHEKSKIFALQEQLL